MDSALRSIRFVCENNHDIESGESDLDQPTQYSAILVEVIVVLVWLIERSDLGILLYSRHHNLSTEFLQKEIMPFYLFY